MKTKLLILLTLCYSYFSHAQWSQVGSTQFTNFASDIDFTFDTLGTPYVFYKDVISGYPVVKKFDGTSWQDVGTSGSWGSTNSSIYTIAIDPVTNLPWVAWKDGFYIRVYNFDGTTWNYGSQPALYTPIN
jgi:hypothetical protein